MEATTTVQETSANGESHPKTRQRWMIVGASRGIGLELVRQLLGKGCLVHGTARSLKGVTAINEVKRHTIIEPGSTTLEDAEEPLRISILDVSDESSIRNMVSEIRCESVFEVVKHIDYVVINAGVLEYPNRATELTYTSFAHHLHTNTIGPIILAQELLKSDIKIGTIAFMSSDSGSATCFMDHEDGFAAYSASKAALNQMLRHMAAELKRKGSDTTILALHPGEVLTDMAAINLEWHIPDQMSPEESVRSLIPVIESKTKEDSGTFWTWRNERYPW